MFDTDITKNKLIETANDFNVSVLIIQLRLPQLILFLKLMT